MYAGNIPLGRIANTIPKCYASKIICTYLKKKKKIFIRIVYDRVNSISSICVFFVYK